MSDAIAEAIVASEGGDVSVAVPDAAPSREEVSSEPILESKTAKELTKESISLAKKSLEEVVAPSEAAAPTPPKPKATFSFVRDGEAVDTPPEGFDDMTVRYKAKGHDVDSTLPELIRRAQQVHGIEDKIERLQTEKQTLFKDLTEHQGELEVAIADRRLFMDVLKDASGEQFKRLQDQFLNGGEAGDSSPPPPEPQAASSLPDDAAMNAGMEVVENHILPWAERVGEAYGMADSEDIVRVFLEELATEPPQFHSLELVAEILNERIPAMLEKEGFSLSGEYDAFDSAVLAAKEERKGRFSKSPSVAAPSEELSALQKENEKLKEQLENAGIQRTVKKVSSAPPSAAIEGAPVRGIDTDDALDLSDAKSSSDVKKALQKLQRFGGRK